VSLSFFLGRKNVYRYAHFFFFWLTSSYVEDSNKMTVSCMFCALMASYGVRMVVQALTCSRAILPTSQHILDEYQVDIRWISIAPLLQHKVSCKKIGI